MTTPTLLKIAEIGHPVLHTKAQPVEDITHPDVQALIQNMLATVQGEGVGLAAPQVYRSLRIFVFASPFAPLKEELFEVAIHPEIIKKGSKIDTDWEGCLSIPDMRVLVPRATDISVRYTRQDGTVVETVLTGFLARVFQHELDHLDGILIFDRMESPKDIMSIAEYERMCHAAEKKKRSEKKS